MYNEQEYGGPDAPEMLYQQTARLNTSKLYFVNRFYAPDSSATGQLLTELTQKLAADFDTAVVTSRYGMNGAGPWPTKEKMSGVNIFRLYSTSLGKMRLWQKALDLLSFHLAIAWFLFSKVKAGDMVVLKTDPPLLQLLNTSLVRLKKGKVINWLQDIYPEIAIRLGKFPGPRFLPRLVMFWRDHACNKAEANIVISGSMAHYLGSRGIRKVATIPNWANSEIIRPQSRETNRLWAEWGLQGQFVVMYSGNFGRVHAFEEIIETVRLLANHPSITFLFVGDGAELQSLKDRLAVEKCSNVSFKPAQAREKLGESLGVADLHLVSLKRGMEDLLMPSKIYGILAAGRPIVFVGESGSCIAKQLIANGVGFAVEHGEGRKLSELVLGLQSQPFCCEEMGKKAQAWFQHEFTIEDAVDRWHTALRIAWGISST